MKNRLRIQTLLIIVVPAILLFVFASMMIAPKGFVPTTLNDFFLLDRNRYNLDSLKIRTSVTTAMAAITRQLKWLSTGEAV